MNKIDGIKFALGQIEVQAGNPAVNAARIIAEAKAAAARGVDVIIFPEMAVPGYLLGDLFEDDEFVASVVDWNNVIVNALAECNIVTIFGSVMSAPEKRGEDGRMRKYNAAIVAHRGSSRFTFKTLHPNYRIFDDDRHFFSMRKVAAETMSAPCDYMSSMGVIIRGSQVNLGVMICEDMWDGDYAVKPAEILAENGADILINISCSPWSWRKNQKRDNVVRDIIKRTGLPFIYVNNVGSQNNGKNFIAFDGSSTMYDGEGKIVYLCEEYHDAVEDVAFITSSTELVRAEGSDVAQLLHAVSAATYGFLETMPESSKQKVVIGVSGGIDSALSVAFFASLLGSNCVIGVNMPYRDYNCAETKSDAEVLCRNLGVEYRVVPIDTLVDAQAALCDIAPGSSQHKSIQARMRTEVLATIASQKRGFFTCNANKVEIAFGYGTLNGDLRGYFAPWMDCLKQDIFRLADFMNRVVFQREVIPQSIIDRPPMDELVSVASSSGSRGDPFHYGHVSYNGYHDQLVRAFVVFRHGPEWILRKYKEGELDEELQLEKGTVAKHFPNHAEFIADLERCYRLFVDMTFKRIQSVPGALVDKRSFGFDLREVLRLCVFTQEYERIKAALLK